MTTTEFCDALKQQPKAGPALAEHAGRALRAWDEHKFSLTPSAVVQDPLHEASTIIDEGQARVAELKRQEFAGPATETVVSPQKE
jgi:hypothetical protein